MLVRHTHKRLLVAASSTNVLIWISLPCTGGCRYNVHQNWHKGEEMRRHIRRLRYCFTYMMECIIDTLRKLICRGFSPYIAVELPESNWYWSQTQLEDFCTEFQLVHYHCDGCMYGLAAKFGPHQGKLLAEMGRSIEVSCNHSNSAHATIKGDLTKGTEEYPELLVEWIHYAFKNNIDKTFQ